ncbi:MAG: VWA domain-containing protein [Halioglobus sp.]
MEEWVGQVWHNLVTRASSRDYPEAAVFLEDVRKSAAILFRALGGDGGLRVEASTETRHNAKRSLLSRVAGSNQHVELAWRDENTLRLPGKIACFPTRELNRELYLWLAALAAHSSTSAQPDTQDWITRNARCTSNLLAAYPGLTQRYRRLVSAHLALRPKPESLPPEQQQREQQIRLALQNPGSITTDSSFASANNAAPVMLWLHPDPPFATTNPLPHSSEDDETAEENKAKQVDPDKRKRGERVDEPDSKGGLLVFRLESLFTRAEYAALDRTQEENEDEDAKACIEDLEILSMSKNRKRTAARLRFDLDLPAEEYDDICIGEGIALPEWDYRSQTMQPKHCHLQPMQARDIEDAELPAHLQSRARRLRQLFEMLKPRRVWHQGQIDGSELDTNALIHRTTDRLRGAGSCEAKLYRNFENKERDLSCLVLADLSLSTDAHVDNDHKIIDVIRDSLHLFGEALTGSSDRFALYGFSSRHRDHVRFHTIKAFDESHSDTVRGRINAAKPGYYTRMGAAIRYATQLLSQEASSQKLLLILTDGKPNDLDKYEGRYGVEDTRMAVQEASRAGMQPFCVTIDRKAGDYLPYLFGSNSYILVKDARELPTKLPALYARLTS